MRSWMKLENVDVSKLSLLSIARRINFIKTGPLVRPVPVEEQAPLVITKDTTSTVDFDTHIVYVISTMPWAKAYGGSGDDRGYTTIPLTDGFLTVGDTSSFGAGGSDVLLLRTDSDGNVQWAKTYGGSDDDLGYSVIQLSDGFAIVGYTESYGAGGDDFLLIKTDFGGNLQWAKAYGDSDDEYGYSVIQLSDGFLIAGVIDLFPRKLLLVKTDVNGNVQWAKTYSGNFYGLKYSILSLSDGFLMTGPATSPTGSSNSGFLIKIDLDGNLQWAKTYDGSGGTNSYSVTKLSDGFAIVGYTNAFGAGDYDALLVKTDVNGNVQWAKTYGGSGDDLGYFAASLSDGFMIVGLTGSFNPGGAYVFITRTDVNGNLQWAKTYGGVGRDMGYSAINIGQTSLITATTTSFGAGHADVLLMRIDVSGNTNASELQVTDVTSQIQTTDITSQLQVSDATSQIQVTDVTSQIQTTDITSQLQVADITSQLQVTIL